MTDCDGLEYRHFKLCCRYRLISSNTAAWRPFGCFAFLEICGTRFRRSLGLELKCSDFWFGFLVADQGKNLRRIRVRKGSMPAFFSLGTTKGVGVNQSPVGATYQFLCPAYQKRTHCATTPHALALFLGVYATVASRLPAPLQAVEKHFCQKKSR